MMKVDNKFNIGQVVYLITDSEQHERMVTSIIVNLYDITYDVVCGTLHSNHYDFELSADKKVI